MVHVKPEWVAVFGALALALSADAHADCGDAILDPGEECDDGNLADGDGCDASCEIELGWACQAAEFTLDFAETLTPAGPIHSGSSAAPNWSLSGDGRQVTQSRNSSAGVYMSTLGAVGLDITMELEVQTSIDDDFFGFVIGYEAGERNDPNANWLLFDWKQADQSISTGGPSCMGPRGTALSRITGPLTNDQTLWCHYGPVEEFARGMAFGSVGWGNNTTHIVRVLYSTTRIQVWVDGQLDFDETGTFPSGNFGFYTFSQQSNRFRLVSPEAGLSVCSELDSDGDGLTDPEEYDLGTDPFNPDTDGDGCSDFYEVRVSGTDPLDSTDCGGCTLGLDNCSEDADCANELDAGFTCTCKDGYEGDGVVCDNIDECFEGTDNCSENATCTDTIGSFECDCNLGYNGDGVTCTPRPLSLDDVSSTITSGALGGAAGNMLSGATVDGGAAASDDLNFTIFFDDDLTNVSVSSAGIVSVPTNTPAGTYEVVVRACDVLVPTSCVDATNTITVNPAALVLQGDFIEIAEGRTGGTPATSVFTNDTLDGAPMSADDVEISLVSNDGLTGLSVSASGQLTVPPNTAAGQYFPSVLICEALNPSNCDSSVVRVVVNAAVLEVVADAFDITSGTSGGTTGSVFANDLLGGAPPAGGELSAAVVNDGGLDGLSVDGAGALTVPAGTPAGSYSAEVEVCQVLNPANCATRLATIEVGPGALVAAADSFDIASGASGGTTGSVFANDTIDGEAAGPGALSATVTGDGGLDGVAIDAATGVITVPEGTPADTYTVTIEVCETLNPDNCAPSSVTVEVGAAALVGADDALSVTSGSAGGTTASVLSNDTLDGDPVPAAAVSVTVVDADGISGLSVNAAGALVVPSGTTAGSYTLSFEVCELLNPTNCVTTSASLEVGAGALALEDDVFVIDSGRAGGVTGSVLTNDSRDGQPLTPADVLLTLAADDDLEGLILNEDGTLDVPPATPAGTYTATVRVCEALNTDNCAFSEAEIEVGAAALAVEDDALSVGSGALGGTTASVLTNDRLDDEPFDAVDVLVSIDAEGGLDGVMVDADGVLTIPAGTPAGLYEVSVQVCEALNPSNCGVSTASVTVSAASLAFSPDQGGGNVYEVGSGHSGGTTDSVFDDFMVDGERPGSDVLEGSVLDDGGLDGVSVNEDGTLDVPPGTPAGTYEVAVEVCERLNPTNCTSVVVEVEVGPGELAVADDTLTVASGLLGGQTSSVLANDTLDGVRPADDEVVLSIVDDGGLVGLSLGADGRFTVPAGTPADAYEVEVEVCEALNPGNCRTSMATITVGTSTLSAVDDAFSISSGAQGGTTPSVFANDELDGMVPEASTVTVSITDGDGLAGVSIDADGIITVPPGTEAGTYDVEVQVCEVLNSTSCATSVATVTVGAASLQAFGDSFFVASGRVGGVTPSVLVNDRLDGVRPTADQVVLAIDADGGLVGVILNADGTFVIPPGTPEGQYLLTVRVSEALNPTNSATAPVQITVGAASVAAPGFSFVVPAEGGVSDSVFDGVLLDGELVAAGDATAEVLDDGGLTGVTVDDEGRVVVPPGAPAGDYVVELLICEALNPGNCEVSEVQITVEPELVDTADTGFPGDDIPGDTDGTGTPGDEVLPRIGRFTGGCASAPFGSGVLGLLGMGLTLVARRRRR